jgi:hypothetical protein
MPDHPSSPSPASDNPAKVDESSEGPAREAGSPPAGESEAANDRGLDKDRKGDDEETMPIEEGFSLVP